MKGNAMEPDMIMLTGTGRHYMKCCAVWNTFIFIKSICFHTWLRLADDQSHVWSTDCLGCGENSTSCSQPAHTRHAHVGGLGTGLWWGGIIMSDRATLLVANIVSGTKLSLCAVVSPIAVVCLPSIPGHLLLQALQLGGLREFMSARNCG